MGHPPAHDSVLTEYARSLIAYKARKLSRMTGFSHSDEDDIAQALTLRLLEQSHRFDPNRASANTFAALVVESAVSGMFRQHRTQKRAPGLGALSVERDLVGTGGELVDIGELLITGTGGRGEPDAAGGIADAERRAAVIDALESLPASLQEVAARLPTSTEAGIARDLGISRRQVRNSIAEIRRRIADARLERFLE